MIDQHEDKGRTRFMSRFLPAVFAVVGILDLVYGIVRSDTVSIIAGPAMVAIALYIWRKDRGAL